MAGLGLRAVHPDAFLLDLHHAHPGAVPAALRAARDKATALGGSMSMGQMLKRCRLPRLARAVKVEPGCC